MAIDMARLLASQIEGKALGPHPVLLDRDTPVSVYSPGANRVGARLAQYEAPRHLEAYAGKEAIDWVYDCVNLYADTTASADWHLERDRVALVNQRTRGMPDEIKEGPQDLYRLLANPNPFMLYDELMSLLIIDLLLVGNAYWLKWQVTSDGKPLALYRLAPGHVRIIPGPFGAERYEYQPPGAREPLKIDPRDIMHFRLPNPHSAYYGAGVIRGGGRPFDLEIALTDTQASYYENKADPSLIIQSERRIPRDVRRKLQQQLIQRLAGSKRAGTLLLLEAGLRAETLTPSAKEALFEELTGLSRDRIFAMFRASPKLFGISENGSGTDKVQDAQRQFDTYVIRPFMNKLQKRISDGLTAAWGVDFIIDYRYVMPIEDLIRNVGSLAQLPGVKVRDLRRQLAPLGFEESTGDPKVDEMILNLPGEELDANGQGGFADRPLPGERGRPPLGKNTKAFPSGGKALPTGAKVREGKALTPDVLRDVLREAEMKALLRLETPEPVRTEKLPGERAPEDRFSDLREHDITLVAANVESALRDAARTLERGLLDHVEGKAFRPNNVRGRLRNSQSWKTFSESVERVLEDGAKKAISFSVMQQNRLGIRPEEELDYSAISKSVVHRPEGVRTIVRTLKESVLRSVREQLQNGEINQTSVQAAVQNQIKRWTENHAPLIGETEAVVSYNEGVLTVGEAIGETEVFVVDNSEVWSIEQARENRIEHPGGHRAFLLLNTVGS